MLCVTIPADSLDAAGVWWWCSRSFVLPPLPFSWVDDDITLCHPPDGSLLLPTFIVFRSALYKFRIITAPFLYVWWSLSYKMPIDWSIHQSSTPWEECHMFLFRIYLELSDHRFMLLVIRSLVIFSRALSFSDKSAFFYTCVHWIQSHNEHGRRVSMYDNNIHNKFYPFIVILYNRRRMFVGCIHAPQLKGADELQTMTSHLVSNDVN